MRQDVRDEVARQGCLGRLPEMRLTERARSFTQLLIPVRPSERVDGPLARSDTGAYLLIFICGVTSSDPALERGRTVLSRIHLTSSYVTEVLHAVQFRQGWTVIAQAHGHCPSV